MSETTNNYWGKKGGGLKLMGKDTTPNCLGSRFEKAFGGCNKKDQNPTDNHPPK